MTPSSRYLRLFDLEKYRKIQPVIEGIAKRDIEAERVISVIKVAANVIQTDDLKKYNDPDDIEDYDDCLRETLDALQKDCISSWFNKLDRRKNIDMDISKTIISLICCPKYQSMTYDCEAIAGTTIDYTDIYYGSKICDLELMSPLSFLDPIEMLPIENDEDGTAMGIFNRQQLIEMTQVAIQDVTTLSQLDTTLKAANSEKRAEYLRFYDDFNFLLELANVRDTYTILNHKI